jgi:hypothetical protein
LPVFRSDVLDHAVAEHDIEGPICEFGEVARIALHEFELVVRRQVRVGSTGEIHYGNV